MSLLFLTQNYYPNKGGMAESCDRIVRNFRKKGVVVHVVHFTNRKEAYKTETKVNGTYTGLPINNSEAYTLNLASLFFEEVKFLFEVEYIVAFGGVLPVLLAPIICKYYSKKLITMIRGNDFDEGVYTKKRDALLYALNESSFVFTVTSEKRDKIKAITNNNGTFFTQNGINTDHWKTTKSHGDNIEQLKLLSASKKRIVIIGQLKPKKGILEFSSTFSNFKFKDDYEVWMVGDVAEETQEKIESFDFSVRFFPFVNKQELINYYYASDILLIPSFYDGMPNVLLEGGACQCLVVASEVGGIKDVINTEEHGFLFNPLQPISLIQQLTKVHQLPLEKKKEIKGNLYQKIKNNYTEEIEISNYIKYLSL